MQTTHELEISSNRFDNEVFYIHFLVLISRLTYSSHKNSLLSICCLAISFFLSAKKNFPILTLTRGSVSAGKVD